MAEEKEPALIEEEVQDLTEEEELTENFDEDSDSPVELNWTQRIILIVFSIFASLFFILYLFPYEEVARKFITKYAAESNFNLDFKKLHLSFFGENTIDRLVYQSGDTDVRAESITLEASLWQMYKGNFNGVIKLVSPHFEFGEYDISTKGGNIEGNITGLDRDINAMNGSLNIQLVGGKILRSPVIPILDTLKDVSIKSIFLNLKKSANRILIEKATFNLSIAKIDIKGKIELMLPAWKASKLDLQICPVLSKEFAAEREDLANTLIVMTKDLPGGCIPISGTISEPKADIPGIGAPPSGVPTP